MRAVVVIQARLGSTRFPRKVLADLCGKPVLQHVVERAREIVGVEDVIAAIPREEYELDTAFRRLNVFPAWGDPDDVLSRFVAAVHGEAWDAIMRITCDCPLLDPVVASRVLGFFGRNAYDFASNDTQVSGYSDGHDVEIFTRTTLDAADKFAIRPSDREHVTPWMKRNMKCATLYAPTPWTGPKLSVDTRADLDTIRLWMQTRQPA